MVLFCHLLIYYIYNQETKAYAEDPLKSEDAFLDTVLQACTFYICGITLLEQCLLFSTVSWSGRFQIVVKNHY